MRQIPATISLVAVFLVIWAVVSVQSRGRGPLYSHLGAEMIAWGPSVIEERLGFLRIIWANFLHLDLTHVQMNSALLVLLGWVMERFLGSAQFLMLFLSTGMASFLAVLWWAPLSPTAGASGGLFAMMVVMVEVLRRQGQDIRGALVLIGANVVYTFMASGVSVPGHIGGLIVGVIVVWPLMRASTRVQWATLWIVFAVSLLVTFPQEFSTMWITTRL